MNEILRNIFQTLSENAEKNFITNKNAEDYIAEDGLWHCGKCGTPKQFRLPEQLVKMGMPEIVSSFCACQSAKEKHEKAENQLSAIIHHNKEFAHIPEHYLSADINAVELPAARKIGTNYIQNFEKMGRTGLLDGTLEMAERNTMQEYIQNDIDNLKGKLETLIWDSKLIKCRIIRKIGLLDNDNRREILMRKYIKFESTARISREMFMTRQGVYYHLDIGEKEIERFI